MFYVKLRVLYKKGFWFYPGVMEGLGSSGKLVGIISAYPGTSPMLGVNFFDLSGKFQGLNARVYCLNLGS